MLGTEIERPTAGKRLERDAVLPADRSAPQTRHLVAAAPTRVPQVGHTRGASRGAEEVDDLAISRKRRGNNPGSSAHYTIWEITGLQRMPVIFYVS